MTTPATTSGTSRDAARRTPSSTARARMAGIAAAESLARAAASIGRARRWPEVEAWLGTTGHGSRTSRHDVAAAAADLRDARRAVTHLRRELALLHRDDLPAVAPLPRTVELFLDRSLAGVVAEHRLATALEHVDTARAQVARARLAVDSPPAR